MTESSKSDKWSGFMWRRNDDGVLDTIPKNKAEKLFKIIREDVANGKIEKNQPTVIQQQQSPIDTLKMKFVNGEITKEEFEKKEDILYPSRFLKLDLLVCYF